MTTKTTLPKRSFVFNLVLWVGLVIYTISAVFLLIFTDLTWYISKITNFTPISRLGIDLLLFTGVISLGYAISYILLLNWSKIGYYSLYAISILYIICRSWDSPLYTAVTFGVLLVTVLLITYSSIEKKDVFSYFKWSIQPLTNCSLIKPNMTIKRLLIALVGVSLVIAGPIYYKIIYQNVTIDFIDGVWKCQTQIPYITENSTWVIDGSRGSIDKKSSARSTWHYTLDVDMETTEQFSVIDNLLYFNNKKIIKLDIESSGSERPSVAEVQKFRKDAKQPGKARITKINDNVFTFSTQPMLCRRVE